MPTPSDFLSSLGISKTEADIFLKKHWQQNIIIKLGGNVFFSHDRDKETSIINNFATDIVFLKNIGARPIVIHGGGPAIDKKLKEENLTIKFVNGFRITDDAVMKIVKSAMADINQQLCQAIQAVNGKPLPQPNKLVLAKKLSANTDLGWVGNAVAIDESAINNLQNDNTIPVLSPIGFDKNGNDYNINGDNFAGFVAANLYAERFLLMTNVAGVLDKNKNLIADIDIIRATDLIADGTIAGGMIPKIKTAIEAVQNGVKGVVITNGLAPHAILRELFTSRGYGTLIHKK
ncbi:MAG: acetylglutamate kinase [Alphaproteobacteria bacterium]